MRLKDKTAIITGSASGMGQAEALAFAEEGAKLVIADLNLEGAKEVAEQIKAKGGQALPVDVNVTDTKDLDKLIQKTKEAFGSIDILVNNAGIFDKYITSLETTEEKWDTIFNINLKAVFQLTNRVLPDMIERGHGTIVNIASIAGLVAQKGGAAYTASKHGVIGYTKHLAAVYSHHGIKVNAICPGTIKTPMTEEILKTKPTDEIPMDRFGEAKEVADLAIFLASDEARFMNGTIIPIDSLKTPTPRPKGSRCLCDHCLFPYRGKSRKPTPSPGSARVYGRPCGTYWSTAAVIFFSTGGVARPTRARHKRWKTSTCNLGKEKVNQTTWKTRQESNGSIR